MFDYASATFSAKERIGILFKEYDTLRSEIIARTSGGYQLIGISTILFTAALSWLGSKGIGPTFWVVFALFLGVPVVFRRVTRRQVLRIAGRVREIENTINALAGTDDLKWERFYGWGQNPPSR